MDAKNGKSRHDSDGKPPAEKTAQTTVRPEPLAATKMGIPWDGPDAASDTAFLVAIYGERLGRRYEIKSDPVSVGRAEENTIQLNDDNVSRFHCRLMRQHDGVFLYDRGSTNGTLVDGQPVTGCLLHDGDRVSVGRNIFKYLVGENVENAYHIEIYRLMTIDNLTQAYNRAYFEKELDREMGRYFHHGRPVSLVMMDIDFFKKINDAYGHLAGDNVLAQFARLVAGNIRAEDIFGRWGGEEFAVLMPEMQEADAIETAERLRVVVAAAPIAIEAEKKKLVLSMTVSAGVAEADPRMFAARDLVAAADKSLYEAKKAGRNCIRPARRA